MPPIHKAKKFWASSMYYYFIENIKMQEIYCFICPLFRTYLWKFQVVNPRTQETNRCVQLCVASSQQFQIQKNKHWIDLALPNSASPVSSDGSSSKEECKPGRALQGSLATYINLPVRLVTLQHNKQRGATYHGDRDLQGLPQRTYHRRLMGRLHWQAFPNYIKC